MRILVISDLPDFVTGGAEMQASRLIGAWLDHGHQVICLGRRMGSKAVTINGHSVEVHRIWTTQRLGRPGRAISYALSLSWHLLRLRKWPDVIYSRFLGDAALVASFLKSLGLINTPLVPTPANAGVSGDISYLRSVPGSRFLIALLDRHCDAINLIAPKMTSDLREAGFSRAWLTTIPNGIPLSPARPSVKGGPLRAVSVGRLAGQKAYDILIEALSQLPEDVQNGIRFEIIGEGPLRDGLEAAARRLPPGLLAFRGELSSDQVARELDESDLFVLASRYEGMSNAALEAMERRLPVLLTRCGGLDLYLTESMGWVVQPEDPAELGLAIQQVVAAGRTGLQSRGDACRSFVEANFSMAEVAQQYLSLFQRIIDARSRRSP